MVFRITCILSVSFCMFLAGGEAQAQLNQLEFDKESRRQARIKRASAPRSAITNEVSIKKAVVKKAVAKKVAVRTSSPTKKKKVAKRKPSKTKPVVKKVSQKKPKAKKIATKTKDIAGISVHLKNDWLEKEHRFITPRLKGVYSDKSNEKQITSRKSWSKPKSGQCWKPNTTKRVSNKSSALKEVMFRFTGSDDFYDTLNESECSKLCVEENTAPIVSGVALENAKGGTFQIIPDGKLCRYRLTGPEKGNWQVLEAQRMVCNCVAK